jgi:hypothetical protein
MFEYPAPATEWSNVMAVLQMLFAASALLICHAGKCAALRSLLRTVEVYFYSFAPVVMLFYILYKVSYMH